MSAQAIFPPPSVWLICFTFLIAVSTDTKGADAQGVQGSDGVPPERVRLDMSAAADPHAIRSAVSKFAQEAPTDRFVYLERGQIDLILQREPVDTISLGDVVEMTVADPPPSHAAMIPVPHTVADLLPSYGYAPVSHLQRIADDLRSSVSESCNQASIDYLDALSAGLLYLLKERGPRFDAECMHSFFAWRRDDGQVRSDPIPPVLLPGSGAFIEAMVALEMVDTSSRTRTYLCGGLLLPGNRVKTTAHCFGESRRARRALANGDVVVRLLRSPEHEGFGIRQLEKPIWESTEQVKNDVIVLEIDAEAEIPAPKSIFVPVTPRAEPLLVSYFVDFDRSRDVADIVGSRPDWYFGLRWARPGLCQAINASAGCARLICPTINGASGTPIFDGAAYKKGEPLPILGLVSRPDREEANCGPPLRYATLAYTEASPLQGSVEENGHNSPSSHTESTR